MQNTAKIIRKIKALGKKCYGKTFNADLILREETESLRLFIDADLVSVKTDFGTWSNVGGVFQNDADGANGEKFAKEFGKLFN